MAHIFINYTGKDRPWADWIRRELEALGHAPHMHEGGAVLEWIAKRYSLANHMLCVVSDRFLRENFPSAKRRAVQWMKVVVRPNFVWPVFIEPCQPPLLLGNLKRCDLYGLSEGDARARFKSFLAGEPPPFPPTIAALVSRNAAPFNPASSANRPRTSATGKFFISYRRDDSAGHAGRVHDRLEREFGRDLLFMDVDAIPLGADFLKTISDEVAKCDVLLAVIGPGWVDARDDEGKRRLNNKKDFVRVEIATALKRDIPVIPILLEGTPVPKVGQLPQDLKGLVTRNAIGVRHASFRSDMDRLISFLRDRES